MAISSQDLPLDVPLVSVASLKDDLFERGATLLELDRLLTSFCVGHGKVIAVSGEAGIGKTSVLRAFAQMAAARCLILNGGCEDLMASRPLGPLFDMAYSLDPQLLNFLAEERDHVFILNQLLLAIQRSKSPVVMIIEDIHWADEATLDLIKFLGRRAATLPLLLLVSHRDDEPGQTYSIGRVLGSIPAQDLHRISLSPLSLNAVTTMAQAIGRDAKDIYNITNGNPFFVTEILSTRAHAIIPKSIRDAVWARIERCPIEQRVTLEALSIAPGGTHQDLLGYLVTPPQAAQLEQLIEAGILVSDAKVIKFRHELARQSALELLSESRKRNLHLATCDWLALLLNAQDLSVLAGRIHHASAGNNGKLVLDLAPELAARSATLGAHKQAAQFLALALPYADQMQPHQAAQLFESWSYESGLSEQIDDKVIAARHKAIELWQKAGNIEKIGLNYRWLSRLHWYRGEAEEAERFIVLAVQILESEPPGPELAWACSVRSQWAMLNDNHQESLFWGERATDLAQRFGEIEIRVHALNNMGMSLLASGDAAVGRAYMDESLSLALAHKFHEQAARVYTNMSEYAIGVRDLELAETYLKAGIAFDIEHDLDSWLHYLRGCQARYLMMRGDLQGAQDLARDVVDTPNQTMVMQLPAAIVLAQVSARIGRLDAKQELLSVLDRALQTNEAQRIAPVRIALAELAWLSGDMTEVRVQVDAALDANHAVDVWDVGELHCWAYRCGQPILPIPEGLPELCWLECSGKTLEASDAYGRIGMPFEQAVILASKQSPLPPSPRDKVNQIMLNIKGLTKVQPKSGPRKYKAARANAAGLTFKEQQVLRLLSEGASNAQMAATLNRSVRTIEHHVAAVLGKLGVNSRNAAVTRVRANRELLADM